MQEMGIVILVSLLATFAAFTISGGPKHLWEIERDKYNLAINEVTRQDRNRTSVFKIGQSDGGEPQRD